MGKKLIGLGDILLIRNSTSRGITIPPTEIRDVVSKVGESAYTLYTVYRTVLFKEAAEIKDSEIAKLIGWNQNKVKRFRLVLENADLIHIVRYGTKSDGVTRFFVGELQVALFNAGLPADVINPKAIQKLQRELNLDTVSDVINNISVMVKSYESDPQRYA